MATLPHALRLHFDLLTLADAPFVLELVNEPGWLRHIGDRHIHDLVGAEAYIRNGPLTSYARNGFGLWRVSLIGSGETIGLCGLIRRDTLEHPDVGYALLERHAGQGYATEAAAAVLQHAGQALGLQRLLAITSLDNFASMRVLEKIGFVQERLLEDPKTGSSRLFAWQLPQLS